MRAIEVSAEVPLNLEATWDVFFGDELRAYVALSDATLAVEGYELRPDGTPRYRMVQKTGTFTSDYSLFEAPHRTVNQVLDSPFGGTYRITHEPAGEGTRVTHRWEITARNLAVVDELKAVAARKGISLPRLALAWVLANPLVSVALTGARNAAEIEDNIAALDITLTDDERAELDGIMSGAAGQVDAVPQ